MNPALLLQAWQRLPREARDTLFQVGVIGWTLLPHAAHVPAWCTAMAALILLLRARIALVGGVLPGRWTIVAVLAVGAGLTLWSERTLLGKEAGVTLLVVLMTLKTLELRARRDALVVFFLGFFLVLTNFLYSQSLLVALSMLLSVWGLLTALVLAHMPVGRPPLARAGALAARAAVLGAPVMVLLFVLFPRFGPLWGMPSDAGGRTGLSGSLRLGGIAAVANDDSVAFRIRFAGAMPAADALYFRGPVLGSFNGVDWVRLLPSFEPGLRLRAELALRGDPLRYEMTLEPSRLPLLPLLEITPDRIDVAPRIDGHAPTLGTDLQWQLDRPLTERVRFDAAAWPQARHGPLRSVLGLRDWVDLPPSYNPRMLQWAMRLRARLPDADARSLAQAVLQHVARDGFGYTLEPGPYGRDAIDEFWFDRRQGFCEHFAAAFVVAMRGMDVPARIVTGYQGIDPVPQDGWRIVRQSNAHAWAEIWQPGAGWLRVDPTAAVAPDRVNAGRSLAPTPGFVVGALGNVSPELLATLRQGWERVNNHWNQWVLNYSRGQQFDLLKRVGFDAPSWQDLATLIGMLLAGGALAGAVWAWWDRRRQDPWQRLQMRVQRALGRLGVMVAVHDPPRRRAERVRQTLGAGGAALAAELDVLDRQRYAPGARQLPDRRWWLRFAAAAKIAA